MNHFHLATVAVLTVLAYLAVAGFERFTRPTPQPDPEPEPSWVAVVAAADFDQWAADALALANPVTDTEIRTFLGEKP